MIDSHCHLDHEPLYSDLHNILLRSKQEGIKKILTICTTLESFQKIINIIKKDEIIYGTFGIHPHEVKNNRITKDLIVKEVTNYEKIIGIGETGLDFFYNNSEKKDQIESFETHIGAAIDLDVPLIIHSRNAEKETFEILNKYKNKKLRILMHCFTGSSSFAEKLLDLNAFFSASGIITFKKSLDLQNTFSKIPLDNLLFETDSPFLAPEPYRGRKNEPSFVKFTAQKLAKIKKISVEELVAITYKNFSKLFKI